MPQVRSEGALRALAPRPPLLGAAESLRRPARTRLRSGARCLLLGCSLPRRSVFATRRPTGRRKMNTAGPTPIPRQIALYAIAGIGLAVWAFPVFWGLLTSFKTERDVLAYPPVFVFTPTLANYREVIL